MSVITGALAVDTYIVDTTVLALRAVNANFLPTGDQYCGGRLDRPSGTFQTPNWPEKDYPAGVTCSWHIVAPKNQVRMKPCL